MRCKHVASRNSSPELACHTSELMDLTDVAVIGLLRAHSKEIQMCSLFIYMGGGNGSGQSAVQCAFKLSSKRTKETVLFDKDQREVLGE